jgi:hypothetical protein
MSAPKGHFFGSSKVLKKKKEITRLFKRFIGAKEQVISILFSALVSKN